MNEAGADVAAHYDDLDPFYRRIWGGQLHHGLWRGGVRTPEAAASAMTAYLAERLAPRRGEHVCDVGCGYGVTARRLAAGHGVRVTGMTVSRRQWAWARAHADPAVDVFHGDWLENGLAEGVFDAALAVESLAHMPDPARAVAEMARVTRPGGRIVLACWLVCERPRPWERRHLLDPIRREGRLPGMGTETDLRRHLRAAGLRIGRVEDLSREVEPTWPVCLRRTLASVFQDAELRRFLLARHQENRVFALTLVRLAVAYRLGAMRYLVVTAHKEAKRVRP